MYVFIKLFMIAFSLICMSCGNREGISGLPCPTLPPQQVRLTVFQEGEEDELKSENV